MKQVVQIVTDSSSDLPRHLLERFNIPVVPLIVRFGSEIYQDGALSLGKFWEKSGQGQRPQTSQPPVGRFQEVFQRLIDQGKQVLCLTITSKHSGTFNAARVAAERFGEAVQVFDSLSLSLGTGMQVLAAAEAAEAGCTMDEIIAKLNDLRDRVKLTIVLDTLENLRFGGRADGFIAIIDQMTRILNIKPIVNLVDGKLSLLGAARSFRGGLKRALKMIEELGELEQLAVVHTRRRELAEEVADRLAQRLGIPRERIWVRETGAVLASHAGPGVIGVLAVQAAG
jgi:DegV family protein with EDD domain